MSEKYDRIAANHYSAYRPPIHEMILESVLSEEEKFQIGLDVGCGTGYSAIALAKHCSRVYGVEPSESMLNETSWHEKIVYLQSFGDTLPFSDKSVNIVTFAGSLFYTKSLLLIEELKRVCREKTIIIPYDFEVLLDDILYHCGVELKQTVSSYDHEVNFSGNGNFTEITVGQKQVNLEISSMNLAHILLANSDIYDAFVEKYGVADPLSTLVGELNIYKNNHQLRVNTYYSKYLLNTL